MTITMSTLIIPPVGKKGRCKNELIYFHFFSHIFYGLLNIAAGGDDQLVSFAMA